jgi:hypothetical protein
VGSPSREQHQREEEKKKRLGQNLRPKNDQGYRRRGEHPGDQSGARGDQSAEGRDECAGAGIDHGLNECDRPRNVADGVADTSKQHWIKRHAVGHRQQSDPKGVGFRQGGGERPVSERILLRKEGVAMRKQHQIDQANN